MSRIALALGLSLAVAGPAFAQGGLPIGTRVGSAVPAAPEPKGYDEGGRRDPFVSLLVSKKPVATSSARPKAGLPGVSLADISVKGVVQNNKGIVAVLEAPGGKSYVARSKDKLADAVIKSIDPDGVVFVQQVVDALGVARPRDVRKSLRQTLIEEER